MRRLIYTAAVSALIALGSTGASAAVTVTSSGGYPDLGGDPCNPVCGTNPPNLAVSNNNGSGSIVFGINPVGLTFDTNFVFNNSVGGSYNIELGTSTQGLMFTLVTVTGGGATLTFAPPAITSLQQFGISLLANTNYTVRVAGTSPTTAGEWHGGITVVDGAVPEPATWAMMLLGFGGIGIAMRRRRSVQLRFA